MTTTDLALPGADLDDNWLYQLHFVQHRSLHSIAADLGCDPETIRNRLRRITPLLRPGDHDQLRDEEGVRLTELRSTAATFAATCLDAGEYDLALKALREAHAITRTMIQLYGLERRPGERPTADPDEINSLLGAFIAGATAATQTSD